MTHEGIWGYRADSGYETGTDLIVFKVEEADGSIGKIDEHTDDAGAGYLVSTPAYGSSASTFSSPPAPFSASTVTTKRSTSTGGRTRSRTPPAFEQEGSPATPATLGSSPSTTPCRTCDSPPSEDDPVGPVPRQPPLSRFATGRDPAHIGIVAVAGGEAVFH